MNHSLKRWGLVLHSIVLCSILALVSCGGTSQFTGMQETVVAGSPDRFMEVRHVLIRGSNTEIGEAIGEIARRNGTVMTPLDDHETNNSKRIYMEEHYPVYYERMKGVAAAYDLDVEDDRYDFTSLFQNTYIQAGCSVVFYPGSHTETGHGLLSRNYDFTTGNVRGKYPGEWELPIMARPFIFELYPEEGLASLSIMAFDYLGGTLDGVNSEGLTVAILADGESMQLAGLNPTNESGLHELMGMRYLLDNCRNTTEAREALLSMNHYYTFIPCHYIVADRNGRSFIFEISTDRESFHITDGEGPQCITNHLVYKHPDVGLLPQEDSFNRYKKLSGAVSETDRFTFEEIEAINKQVAVPPYRPGGEEYAPGRTLWYAVYDTHESSLKVSFYIGEKSDPTDEAKVVLDYTDYLDFKIKK